MSVGRLSPKSARVLQLIAEGHSYAQIVDGTPGTSYLEIFAAAEEALRLLESSSDYEVRMAAIKERYPRAYQKWEQEEDDSLRRLHGEGHYVAEIAERLQRQPGAIRSRLAKLGVDSGEVTQSSRGAGTRGHLLRY